DLKVGPTSRAASFVAFHAPGMRALVGSPGASTPGGDAPASGSALPAARAEAVERAELRRLRAFGKGLVEGPWAGRSGQVAGIAIDIGEGHAVRRLEGQAGVSGQR